MPTLKPLERPLSAGERSWYEASEEFRTNALETTRASANGWVTALGSLTGLLGLLTLFKGPEDVLTLGSPYKEAMGALILVAFTAAIVAIGLAASAAHGRVKKIWTTAEAVRVATYDELKTATERLMWSRRVAGVAMVALIAAVAVAWYGPRPARYLLIEDRDGNVTCLQRIAGPQQFSVPLGDVRVIRAISVCPPR